MIDALEHQDVIALERASTAVKSIVKMDIAAITRVMRAFFDTPCVSFRDGPAILTSIGPYEAFRLETTDYAGLVRWCADWTAGQVDPALLFYTWWVMQPLADGNKRLGMLFTEAYCTRHGKPLPYFRSRDVHQIKVTLFAIHYGDQPVDALHKLIF